MAKVITMTDIQKKINTLSVTELLSLLDAYSKTTGTDITTTRSKLIADDLQNNLIANGINTTCPYCNSTSVVGFGKNGNVKRFKCKECEKTFTLFTNTILEKTKYHWDVWVKVLEMVLNNIPLEHMQETLVKDYGLADLNSKTVFLWRHKLIHALAEIPMPRLSGIVQIDETFFREGQKGSRNLVSTVKGEDRKARYGRRPSKYGVMGNEFANVVCMTDLKGYTVSKVIGLGKLTVETFTELFDDYIDNPSYICSDGNTVYKDYCTLKNIPLYVKPSNYVSTIQKAGYVTPDWSNPTAAKVTEEANNKILTKLYNDGLIDYIYNRGYMDYKTFSGIKNANSLSLARVNQFHAELKRHLEYNTKGVSTKYLPDYIGFYTFIRNWKTTHGHYPTSHKDAESILIDILKGKTTYTTADLESASMDFQRATDKYMKLLKKKTAEMRRLTKNPYFKYDEEDNVISFDKRKYLSDLPAYKLEQLRKQYKIKKGWAKYSIVSELLKQADINETIMLLINEDKQNKVSEEDLKFLEERSHRVA